MGQRFAVVLLAVALVTAGCLGGPGGQTTTAPSPDTATTTPTATPTPEPDYRTGFGPAGVTNATAAASAHADALLASDGFAFAFNVSRTNGGQRRGVYRSRVDLVDRQVWTYVARPDATYVQFYGNGTVYERITQNGETTYQSSNASIPLNGTTGRATVQQLLAGIEYGEATVVEGGFEYESTALQDAKGIVGVRKANVSDFSATVLVGENGVVRTITYTATYTEGGTEHTMTATLSVTDVGETDVTRPEWTSQA